MATIAPDLAAQPSGTGVVVVLVGGLTEEAARSMPTLRALSDAGARGDLVAQTAVALTSEWATLLTGAGRDLTGAPLLAGPRASPSALGADHVLAAAQRAGLPTAVVGSATFCALFGAANSRVAVETVDSDDEALGSAQALLSADGPAVLWVCLDDLAHAVTQAGATSDEAAQAALRTDSRLRALLHGIDLRTRTLALVSDWGPGARRLGGEPSGASRAPLILAGQGIRPGPLGDLEPTALAPTLAALLGVPPPALCEADALWPALALDEVRQAEWLIGQARQRAALASAYVARIGGPVLGEAVDRDVSLAVASLEAGNVRAASQSARFALQGASDAMRTARDARLSAERLHRTPLALLGILLPALLWVWRIDRWRCFLLVCALLAPLVYQGIYLAQGHVYSLTELSDLHAFVHQTSGRMALALGVSALPAAVACVIGYVRSRRWAVVALGAECATYGLQVCYLLILPVMVCFAANGLVVGWHVPDARLLHVQASSLVQALLAAAVLAVAPWVAMLLSLPIKLAGRDSRPQALNLAEAPHAHRSHRQ